MRVHDLRIVNFRGIREINIRSLGTMVIIAGQNGSGKSCIFDAIRLLKSVYGGYQQNEWQQWMGEFQIQISNRSSDFTSMFNDPSRELRIACDFVLHPDERDYINRNSDELLRETVWRTILPEAYQYGGYRTAAFAAQFRDKEDEVRGRIKKLRPRLLAELASDRIHGECFIEVGGTPMIVDSVALAVVFSTFRPREIGVIDYHGSQRHYSREYVKGINLSLDENDQRISQSALYNYANKYSNVKSEMAASYVKEILAEQSGIPRSSQSTLTNTLKELFESFFPEKAFLGPQPTASGNLDFPVRTADGHVHDLDELSAGEKEILYGYLRIRNSAPRYSIILLDEPELHLNPRLIRGLPQFYQRNLGKALENQIWLVTHSDALLREVVGREDYNVFHMLPCATTPRDAAQLRPMKLTADLELALVDLVGDLAAYRPGGKVVLFEGGGDADFDKRVAGWLFPDLQENTNLISGTNKARVKALHAVLDRASEQGQLPFKFFAVVDKDTGEKPPERAVNLFSWNVYHIENYFLEPKYLTRVLAAVLNTPLPSKDTIMEELRQCARETLPQLLRHELTELANSMMIHTIDLGTDPAKDDVVGDLSKAVERSLERTKKVVSRELTTSAIGQREAELRTKYNQALADGTWLSEFRGRDILKRFVGRMAPGVQYEVFRNLILSAMREDGFQPAGMKSVVDKILSS